MLVEILVGNSDIEYFFITVIEYNHHFSVKNCHLEVYYIVDRVLNDKSILTQFETKGVNFLKKTLYIIHLSRVLKELGSQLIKM